MGGAAHPSGAKRWQWLVLPPLWLSAGAALSMLMAWGLVLLNPAIATGMRSQTSFQAPAFPTDFSAGSGGAAGPTPAPMVITGPIHFSLQGKGLGWAFDCWGDEEAGPAGPVCRYELRCQAGWPLRCAMARCSGENAGTAPLPPRCGLSAGLAISAADPTRRLGVLPVWPGSAVNSVLYGGLLWLLAASVREVRHRRRARLGQCQRCGYPKGVSSVCTECGAPAPPAAARS